MTPSADQQDTTQPAATQPADTEKVSVVYRASEGDPPSVFWRGRTFIVDKPVMCDPHDEVEFGIIEAARGNPSFDVGGENKAKQRAADAERKAIEDAEVELAAINAAGEEIEQRQSTEMAQLEKRHQQERDEFLNGKEARAVQLRRIVRGSDGSDDLQTVDPDGHSPSGEAPPSSAPTPGGSIPMPPPTEPAAPAPAANQPPEPVLPEPANNEQV